MGMLTSGVLGQSGLGALQQVSRSGIWLHSQKPARNLVSRMLSGAIGPKRNRGEQGTYISESLLGT